MGRSRQHHENLQNQEDAGYCPAWYDSTTRCLGQMGSQWLIQLCWTQAQDDTNLCPPFSWVFP